MHHKPLPFLARAVLLGAFSAGLFHPAAFGQTAPEPSAPPAAAAPDSAGKTQPDLSFLSPFEVTADADQGYAARDTVAGTRFKSDLKDVPSEVSVMTKEFLDDTAAVSIEDAYRYSLNVENNAEYNSPTAGGGDFTNGVLNMRTQDRIRGLTVPGNTHDFFLTTILQDTYNLDRISVLSGPNAILFGTGNPGGIVDTTFIRARLQRPTYQVAFRDDNYGSLRTSVDLNQPILKDHVAIRVAALDSNQYTWRQKPSGRDDHRLFLTATVKPFKLTEIRAYYENSNIAQTPARNTRAGDRVTPWIAAGRPTFNNGLNSPTTISSANSSIFARETLASNILTINGLSGQPQTVYGSAASANIALPATVYDAKTIGPGDTPNQTGVDSYIYSLPHNESISPYDVDINGNSTENRMKGKIFGFSLEQDLTHHLFFEADYNRERAVNDTSDILRGGDTAVYADANLYLPDRVTPNPNLGRYYVETSGSTRTFAFRGEKQEWRAMLSYEADFTHHNGWMKWFGRHQLASMYQWSENMEVQQEFGPMVVPAGTPTSTVIDNTGGSLYRTFGFREYLSDPTNGATGKSYVVSLPFDPLDPKGYVLPNGSTYYAGYRNPFGAQSAATMNNSLLEGKVFAMQNFFLNNRLVTSFGWRRDNVRGAAYTTPRVDSAPNAAFVSIFNETVPTHWSTFTAGNSGSMGAVGHVFSWLSLYFNKSSTWTGPTGLINPDDGTAVSGAIGKGKDYGLMFHLLGGRVDVRLNRYDNTSGPTTNTGFRNAIIPTVQNIEQTLIDRTTDGTIPGGAPRPKFYDPTQATYALSTLTADMVSKGYEAEITANLTRNWRLVLNGTKETATQSNIGKSWINFIDERAPIWAQYAGLSGPGATTTTIGTNYLSIIQTLNQMKQSDGQTVEDGRGWRANLVTRYTFSEGPIKGVFIGGGDRWRSKEVIGYRASLVTNAFPLAGSPSQLLVPALDAPIYGKSVADTEIFFGYQRRLGRNVTWRGQVNIRNVLNNRDILDQRANITSGFVTVYAVPEPRSFIFTNSFDF